MKEILRKLFVGILLAVGIIFAVLGYQTRANAQATIDIGTQKNPNFQTFTIKEAYPFPGVYCSVERPTKSFEESAYVAFDISLVTVDQIRKCMNKIPKGFVLREEYVAPLFAEDLWQSQVGHIFCEFAKPRVTASATAFPRYKITFVALSILKDEDIKKCFEDAFDKQNIFKPMLNGVDEKKAT